MKAIVLASVLAINLAGCATPPLVYAPATTPNAAGFSDARIENDRYRISYRAPVAAPSAALYDFALLRAAEVTLQQGYDWFRVTDRSDDVRGARGPRLSLGTGGVDYGRSSAVGVGVSGGFYLGGGPTQSVTLEIQLGKGPVPRDRDIYDANDVATTIGARVHASA